MTREKYKAKYGKERAEIKAALARNRSDVTALTFEMQMKHVDEDAEELRQEGASEYEVEEFKKRQRRWLSELAAHQNRYYEKSDDKEYRKAMGREFQKRKAVKRANRKAAAATSGLVVATVAALALFYYVTRDKNKAAA